MAADFSSQQSPAPSLLGSERQQQRQVHPLGERSLSSSSPSYEVAGMPHSMEDIIICVDVDRQVDAEMKVTGAKGQVLVRLDAIKQAIFLFVHSKLMLHPNHRFAFATIGHTASWLQQNFTNEMDIINNTVRSLCSSGTFPQCDLTRLFQMAAFEARKSQAHGRIVRVILIYSRSDVVPHFPEDWPENQSLFTFDAMYLHDKPSQHNCPQQVYDALVEALERVSLQEGYIYESGSGLSRVLFRQMCCLLSHPQQRCPQDDFDIPKDIAKVTTLERTETPANKKDEEIGATHAFA